MRLSTLASTTPFRAWCGGFLLAAGGVWLPSAGPFFTSLLVPLCSAALALYALLVRPRAFAASGVLLGVAPLFAWGVIDGLMHCARVNRSPSGRCEADPSAQVALMVLVYAVALVVTALAVKSAGTVRT